MLLLPGLAVVSKGDLEAPRPRISRFARAAAISLAVLHCTFELPVQNFTHSRVCDGAWCLDLHYTLYKLDAAYSHSYNSRIPPLENVGLDGGHSFPCLRVCRVVDAR